MITQSKSDFVPGLVSIIVASYNHAEYLVQRMESLLNQTYPNFEIIVIDDHSTDESVKILQKYDDHPRVQLILNQKNSGWVNVSNQGVSLARGEYILFANCDDYAMPDQIKLLVAGFTDNQETSICFSRSFMVDQDNNILGNDFDGRKRDFKKFCQGTVVIPRTIMAGFLMNSCVIPNLSGALIKRADFLEAGGFSSEYKVVSDWDLFFKLCRLGDTVYVSDDLNNFRQHKDTIRATTKEKIIYQEIFSLLYSQLKAWDFSGINKFKYKKDIAEIWIDYLSGSFRSARENFKFHLQCNTRENSMILWYFFLGFLTLPVRRIKHFASRLLALSKSLKAR